MYSLLVSSLAANVIDRFATNRARATCRARACTLASDRAGLIGRPAVHPLKKIMHEG